MAFQICFSYIFILSTETINLCTSAIEFTIKFVTIQVVVFQPNWSNNTLKSKFFFIRKIIGSTSAECITYILTKQVWIFLGDAKKKSLQFWSGKANSSICSANANFAKKKLSHPNYRYLSIKVLDMSAHTVLEFWDNLYKQKSYSLSKWDCFIFWPMSEFFQT